MINVSLQNNGFGAVFVSAFDLNLAVNNQPLNQARINVGDSVTIFVQEDDNDYASVRWEARNPESGAVGGRTERVQVGDTIHISV